MNKQSEPVTKVWHDTDEVPIKGAEIVYYNPYKNRIESRKGGMSSYLKRYCKWAYTADLVGIVENPLKFFMTSQEEHESDEFEKEVERWRKEKGADNIRYYECARHFADWQKQQMMKDAVDAKVTGAGSREGSILLAAEFFAENVPVCKYGDKVKLIIVKEE